MRPAKAKSSKKSEPLFVIEDKNDYLIIGLFFLSGAIFFSVVVMFFI